MSKDKLSFIQNWFTHKKWVPLPFQMEAWKLIFTGASGLISVPTGAGKTYAAYLGALANLHANPKKGIQILYITPLRALARDLEMALQQPINDLQLPYRVEMRTGDTSTSLRAKQVKNPPEILLTTPESLAILLSQIDAQEKFKKLQTVIIDEWHELLGSKRGVLLELNISRLKKWNTTLLIWGLTATIGNLQQAAEVCVGLDRKPVLIKTEIERELLLETLLPPTIDKLPWAGQLGMKMLPFVLQKLSPAHSTLIFTNTRSQAERWHQAILDIKPEWKSITGLHHSSIDRKEREIIEEKLKFGILKFVICTSSLDLGVDFSPVEKVFQIGSPKSIARLLQRAGRSSHRPLTPSHLCIVPTHALEIVEIKAYRMALKEHLIEKRYPLKNCYDVLFQHLMTCAIGGGFKKRDLFEQIISTYAFQQLSYEEYESCLQFLMEGGSALEAYPEYKKLILEDGIYHVIDKKLIQFHRMNIGTITSDPHIPVKMSNGKSLGIIEENFLSSLKPGDHFLFSGRVLELIQFRDLTAYVRISKGLPKTAAVWQGGRLPFSAPLGELLRRSFDSEEGNYPEKKFLEEILDFQRKTSIIPHANELLIEVLKSREGWHLFVFPFEGRLIHQGLAYLIASMISRVNSSTFKMSSNDYGFELLTKDPFDEEIINNKLFSFDNLEEEIPSLINIHELARSFFRDIARISGLIFQGYPGRHKTHRQIQVSSGLLYEVFNKYDPQNLLLKQAKKEVLQQQFDIERIRKVLERLSKSKKVITHPQRFSPFALPLFIEQMSGHLTTESIAERIEKIKKSWKQK
jgi:ATP-dependent helicase Lhr and Lhr-like helicase